MKHLFSTLFGAFFVICVCSADAISQDTPSSIADTDSWKRIVGDDGRMSVEIPLRHRMFSNKSGFSVAGDYGSYRVTNVYFVNAYVQDSLISLEIYKGGRDAFESIYESVQRGRETTKETRLKLDKLEIKQFSGKSSHYFSLTQMFFSHGHVYVLTAASRNGETPAMGRFLSSVKFDARKDFTPDPSALRVSDLELTDIIIGRDPEIKNENSSGKPKSPAAEQAMLENRHLIVLRTPQAGYAEAARQKNIQGRVRLRVTLSEDGFVPKIWIQKSMPNGLLQQALFAAARIRFLPKLDENRRPISTIVTLEYSFSTY